MKVVETITTINADKTIIGSKDVELTLDTETGEITLDTPAMFTKPVIEFNDLRKAVDNLEKLYLGQ